MDRPARRVTRRTAVGALAAMGMIAVAASADAPGSAPAPLSWAPAVPADWEPQPTGPVHEPEEFGAAGDGVVDDTRALQDAVDAVRSAGSGTVALRAGAVYLVSSIDIQHGLTIEGPGARLLRPPRHPNWIRTLSTEHRTARTEQEHSSPIVLRGFTVDGRLLEQGPFRGYEQEQSSLIFLGGRRDSWLRQLVRISDLTVKNSVSDGIHLFTNTFARITDLTGIDCFRGGLTITGGGTALRLTGYRGSGEITGAHMDIELDTPSRGALHGDFEIRDAVVADGPHTRSTDIECGQGGRAVIARSAFRSGFTIMGEGGRVEIRDSELHGKDGSEGLRPRTVHRGDDVVILRCDLHAHARRVVTPESEALAAARIQHAYSFDPPGSAVRRHVLFEQCTFRPAQSAVAQEDLTGMWVAGGPVGDGVVVVRDCTFAAGLECGVSVLAGGHVSFEGRTVFDSQVGVRVAESPSQRWRARIDYEDLQAGPGNERLWDRQG